MKKMTLAIALTCMAALAFSQVSFNTVWELSKAANNYPAYIGDAHQCRGIAVGNFDGEKSIALVSRVGGLKVLVLKAADGTQRFELKTEGITPEGHGAFPLNNIGMTADGKILACNLALAVGQKFVVYQWDSKDSGYKKVLSYSLDKAYRLGDYMTVTGSVKDGSALIYAVSAKKLGAGYQTFTFSMKKDDGGNWIFDATNPKIKDIVLEGGNTVPALALLPGGNYLYNAGGQPMRELDGNFGLIAEHVLPTTAMSVSSSAPAYITTKGADVYVASIGYSTDLNCAVVAKITNNDWANAVPFKTPKLGEVDNTNGAGGVVADVEGDKTYLYVLATQNGIGKYEMKITETSVHELAHKVAFEQVAGRLSVKGIEPSSIEVFNLLGQSVRASRLSNEVETAGLRGAYLVQVKADGRLVKSEKVIIR